MFILFLITFYTKIVNTARR